MQRNELATRAGSLGFDHTTITNDSKLEQKVLYLEKRQAGTAITGTNPTTTLTSTGVALNNETLTIGNRTYTFKTTLTGAPNEVLIGAAATNTLDNLKDAINHTNANEGTTYGAGTVRNADFTAGTKTATTLVIASTDTDANGSTPTTETLTNFSFTGATTSAGVLGSKVSDTTTSGGPSGISGDRNTTL